MRGWFPTLCSLLLVLPCALLQSPKSVGVLADDPEIRGRCMQLIEQHRSPWSQYEQDTFIWHNYLQHLGQNRTYVDVGAYDPERLSNTAFLDLCLGWKGLCIEMNNARRSLFENSNRTCTFVNSCVSDDHFQANMLYSSEENPWSAQIQDDVRSGKDMHHNLPTVQCRPLASILAEHGMFDVNFMSIDIEGEEIRALSVFPFVDFNVETMVVESVHVSDFALNYLLTMNGYRLEQQLAIDSFFVKRGLHIPQLDAPRVYPQRWEEVWQHEVNFRCTDLRQCSHQERAFFWTIGFVHGKDGGQSDATESPIEAWRRKQKGLN